MSTATKDFKFSLKVMINKEQTKVLFAEADSDFADVLLSFLTLPLGTIVRILKEHYGYKAPIFGSLNTLYDSVTKLDNVHFWTEAGRKMLLNPRSSFEAQSRKLKLNLDNSEPVKHFGCETSSCGISNLYFDTGRCCSNCRKPMNKVKTTDPVNQTSDGNGVFTLKHSSFIIRDDLRLEPMVIGYITQFLSDLGATDIDGARLKTVTVGFNEIMDLLKGSLLSRTPLTDMILHNRHIDSSITVKSEYPLLQNQIEKEVASKKMIIKVIVQKSTDKFLYVIAEEDFIDFLFSFLTIPLGGVEYILGSNTCLDSIDNLYRSTTRLSKYLKNQDKENSLLNPKLAPNYCSKNHFFPLMEQCTPQTALWSLNKGIHYVDYVDPKGYEGSYLKAPQMYLVTDDLTIAPMSLSSSIILLQANKISFSDVKELKINVGMEQALSILKASLTSTCALTDGLIRFLKKQPKQEK